MKFLVDRCGGRRVASSLREEGHDVAKVEGPDPGDAALLARAAGEGRVLITLDRHFLQLIFHRSHKHAGLVRLPDVPAGSRIALLMQILTEHHDDLEGGAVVSVRGDKIRVSLPALPSDDSP